MVRPSRLVVVSDFVLSFMWVCSGVLLRLLVFKILGFSHTHLAEILKIVFSIVNMFFFAFLAKVSRGGAHNPLPVLVDAISGDFHNFLFCVGYRIPAQVKFSSSFCFFLILYHLHLVKHLIYYCYNNN